MTVEIYLCKEGQPLQDGRLVHSDDILDRTDAEADALERCRSDPTLAKVAYYKLKDDGDFRIMYSYTNPNPVTPKKKRPGGAQARSKKPAKKKPPPKKKGFWRNLLGD